MLILLCVNIVKSFQTLIYDNFHQGHYNSDLNMFIWGTIITMEILFLGANECI